MSRFIQVPVLWNFQGTFGNNTLASLNITSRFVAVVAKPTKPYPPASTGEFIGTLQVEDPNLGTLYLNMPYGAYQAAIRASSGSVAPLVQTLMLTVSGTPTTLSDSRLEGATLVAVWNGGILYNNDDLSIDGDTITFPSALGDEDIVGIIYYTS